ncbi:hypothetical protein BD410DRAFT_780724 [Rickenella mellea]|uniref:Uncharacterized protein n=1 Tax=Rickenella mellea TaxID=50990 RepID=A0A4R5XHA4_9AGAM|nr:hypothetical protein BD410DRAFT_780724 [Rickenella mellea]
MVILVLLFMMAVLLLAVQLRLDLGFTLRRTSGVRRNVGTEIWQKTGWENEGGYRCLGKGYAHYVL